MNDSYQDCQRIGQTEGKLKTGLWKDVNNEGVVYRVGEYQAGIPIGLWQVNYPDGTIRKTILLDSAGNLVCWARYFKEVKIVEVSFQNEVPTYVYHAISDYEQTLFGYELMQYQTNAERASVGNVQMYMYRDFHFDVSKVFDEMPDLLRVYDGSYRLKYWHLNSLLRMEYFFSDGSELTRVYYEYKNKRLKRKRIYFYGKLRLMETYNKDGIKVKEKKYD